MDESSPRCTGCTSNVMDRVYFDSQPYKVAKLQSYRTMLKPTGVVRSIDDVLRGYGVEDVRQSSDFD